MNLSNIAVGQVFSNYRELCKYIEIDIKGGKSKTLQLEDLSRYFLYGTQGNKYIIIDIYNTPKEKIDNRKNNGNKDKHSTVCMKDIDNRINNGNQGCGRFSDILQKQLLITAMAKGENKLPYYTPYNLMCDYLCFLTYDDYDEIEYNSDGYIKTWNRNEDKYIPDYECDVEGVKDYKFAFKTEFVTKIKSACKTLHKKDSNFIWREDYLIDDELNTDEEMKTIIDNKLRKVRETVKQIFQYKSVIQIFKNENSLLTYINLRQCQLEEIAIEKLQKVFVFDYLGEYDKDKYIDITLDIYDDSINLKSLFEIRMETVKEKLKKEKDEEYCNEVDLAHNNMWDVEIVDDEEDEEDETDSNLKYPVWWDFINNETIIDEE